MPVLGICRGMQLLNVALGGDLVQHLGGEVSRGATRRCALHTSTVHAGNAPGGVLGDRHPHTHSCHHQAPDRLGAGCGVAET